MGYGQRLKVQHTADGRVVKAQLDFICDDVNSARYTAPVWAGVLAFLASSQFGLVGHASVLQCAAVVGVIAAVTLAMAKLVHSYNLAARRNQDYDVMQAWFRRFMFMQAAISTAWGLVPWLLWEPGLQINHVFLAGMMAGVIATQAVMRINHIDMFLASFMPVAGLTAARFVFGETLLDHAIAATLVLYVIQFNLDGRRLTRRVGEDSRLRFQVEDLARELEETRDEALRKRFEAETANASKTAFLANMSHELRTPLNAILGFSEIIAQECFGPTGSPRYKEYAGDIHSSGAHLLSLINDLLDVAKIEAGKMDIDPNPLEARKTLEGALKIMVPKAREKRQQLIIDVEPDAPPLYADERALKQILINLVSNASKFTPEGGRIAVIAGRAPGGQFQIMVEDNGPGVPREKLDRIFTPFNQVDNRYDRQAGGTGLGLALVRGLAELHGGRAWIESEYGHGCKVFVVLPSDAANAHRNSETAAA
ncbi:MAG TPA: HAMP domain-containing sensor histidine kinase [Rhizomicrobium sp.]|nr:HAMP domain-containing sensor histidine kinase [Rhizomicrobium sp.]